MTHVPLILRYRGSPDLNEILAAVPELLGNIVYDGHAHPDLEIIAPLEEKTSISIDQVHTLTRRETFHPHMASQTSIVFFPAHALTIPAQQALLKTLEESPADTQFLLVTNRPHALIPTILSRATLHTVIVPGTTTEILPPLPSSHAAAIAESDRLAAKREIAIAELEKYIERDSRPHVRLAAIRTLKLLSKNINTKLALDTFFFAVLHEK